MPYLSSKLKLLKYNEVPPIFFANLNPTQSFGALTKLFLTSLIALFIGFVISVDSRYLNGKRNITLSSLMSVAHARTEACVDVSFLADHYKQGEHEATCYDSEGNKCGIEKTCDYDEDADDCQETVCNI